MKVGDKIIYLKSEFHPLFTKYKQYQIFEIINKLNWIKNDFDEYSGIPDNIIDDICWSNIKSIRKRKLEKICQ